MLWMSAPTKEENRAVRVKVEEGKKSRRKMEKKEWISLTEKNARRRTYDGSDS